MKKMNADAAKTATKPEQPTADLQELDDDEMSTIAGGLPGDVSVLTEINSPHSKRSTGLLHIPSL